MLIDIKPVNGRRTQFILAKTQIDKSKEAAKQIGGDEFEEAFDAKLERIAKSLPPKGEKTEKKPGQ